MCQIFHITWQNIIICLLKKKVSNCQIIWPIWLEVSHSRGRLVHTLRQQLSKLSSLSCHHCHHHHHCVCVCVYEVSVYVFEYTHTPTHTCICVCVCVIVNDLYEVSKFSCTGEQEKAFVGVETTAVVTYPALPLYSPSP